MIMKTAISMPDELFIAADKAAKRLWLSRSQLYAQAVAAYLEEFSGEAITEQLNEVYAEETAGLDPVLSTVQSLSLGDDSW